MKNYLDIVEMHQRSISKSKKRKFLLFGSICLVLIVFVGLLWYNGSPNANLISGAQDGNTAEVRKALDQGADVTFIDESEPPLYYAAMGGHLEIVDLLLRHGADPNFADLDGWTPLGAAAANGYPAVVNLLLSHGANPNAAEDDGTTALMYADLAVAQILLAYKADVNHQDKDGQTALMHAVALSDRPATAQQRRLISLLLRHGAKLQIKDAKGQTALSLAVQYNHPDLVALLK